MSKKSDIYTTTTISVYTATNTVNGKCYVGSSVTTNKRWLSHIRYLNNGNHQSIKFQRAWNKYGKDAFVWEVVEEIKDITILLVREQIWIDKLKPEYNMTLIVGTTMLGRKHSPESIEKMRVAAHLRNQNPEYIQKLRVKNSGWANIKGGDWLSKLSPEDREAHISKLRGRPSKNMGSKRTPESIQRLREAAVLRYQDPEYREKIRLANQRPRNREQSEERRLNQAAFMREYHQKRREAKAIIEDGQQCIDEPCP